MIEGSDYTSSDSSTFHILNGGADDGDVIEAVAYKAFNASKLFLVLQTLPFPET